MRISLNYYRFKIVTFNTNFEKNNNLAEVKNHLINEKKLKKKNVIFKKIKNKIF